MTDVEREIDFGTAYLRMSYRRRFHDMMRSNIDKYVRR